jgi:hypothetical protein
MISSLGRDWHVSKGRSNNGAATYHGRELNDRSRLGSPVCCGEALLISATR